MHWILAIGAVVDKFEAAWMEVCERDRTMQTCSVFYERTARLYDDRCVCFGRVCVCSCVLVSVAVVLVSGCVSS